MYYCAERSRDRLLRRDAIIEVRSAEDGDYPDIMRLLDKDKFVVKHTAYTYWVLQQISPKTMLVGIANGRVRGFLAGIGELWEPSCSLLLQIVVDEKFRRKGIGTRLVREFADKAIRNGRERIILTIHSGNKVSEVFFRSFAVQHDLIFSPLDKTGTLGGILEEERKWELAPREGSTRVKPLGN